MIILSYQTPLKRVLLNIELNLFIKTINICYNKIGKANFKFKIISSPL